MSSGDQPHMRFSRLPQPEEDPQPPNPPPLELSKGLPARIRKLRNRFDDYYNPQSPSVRENTADVENTVPRGTPVEVKVDEVIKTILLHKDYVSPIAFLEVPASDQPKFDDLEPYNVTDEQAQVLWSREAERLVNVVTDARAKLRFSGQSFLNEGSKEGYAHLSSIAKRILEAAMICQQDNQILLLVHYKDLYDEDKLHDAQRRLGHYKTQEADAVAVEVEMSSEQYRMTYFALVDYLTATTARFLAQSVYGKLWVNFNLAALAMWATKVKVISENLSVFASISLDNATSQIPLDIKNPKGGASPDDKTNNKPLSDSEPLDTDSQITKMTYFSRQTLFRSSREKLLGYMLQELINQGNSAYGRPITSYDICSVVYETGFVKGFKTQLFQDRDGEFMASSDVVCLNLAHSAFALADQAARDVQDIQEAQQTHPPSGPQSLKTMIRWSYQEDLVANGSGSGSPTVKSPPPNHPTPTDAYTSLHESYITLTTMENIITVMIPLMLTSPLILSVVKDLVGTFAYLLNIGDVLLYQETNYKAFFDMFTSEFQAAPTDRNASSLPRGLMNRGKLLSGPNIAEIYPAGNTYRDMSAGVGEPTSIAHKAQAVNELKITEVNRIMNQWIFDENAVIVRCDFYVWGIMALSLILVLGGLAIGFTVRGRLIGVDPFGITTYCWVLAAFVTLVCKSLLVQEWPWRDFLLRRVQCRSVSELQAVTGINAQLILAKLLHDESTTILNTRGPFNSAFTRKADNGFSIDEPLTMWTMLLSGLIMLKVASLQGPRLVCLDVRRGTKYSCIRHNSSSAAPEEKGGEGEKGENESPLVSLELSPMGLGKSSMSQRPTSEGCRLSLKHAELRWTRVLGLYNNRDAVFV